MRRRLTTALIAFAAVVGAAAPAHADIYIVTGLGDAQSTPPCTLVQPTIHECSMLRSAVNEISEAGDQHAIDLPAGTIELTAGQLTLNRSVTITGDGARATTVDARGNSRVFQISGGATVSMANFTVANGNVGTDHGANFHVAFNSGLLLTAMRVTGGVANRGAGILNNGTLAVQLSLIDDNSAQIIGGAIANVGSAEFQAQVQVLNSTLTDNYGGTASAIASFENPNNEVQLHHVTVAHNVGAAFWFQHAAGTSASGSIIGPNLNGTEPGPNCDLVSQGSGFASGAWNVATDSTCALTGTTNRQDTDPALASALSNQGGATDVLTMAASSPAIDLVTPCALPVDQRAFTRFSAQGEPCDAGAYERSGVGPGAGEPIPTPTPTVTAQPAQTPTPTPAPVVNRTVVAQEVAGTIRVRVPGSNRFVNLDAARGIPVGSTVDAKRGTVEITSVPRAGRPVEKAQFRQGIFRVTQARGITDLKLTEKLSCSKRAKAAQRKPKKRKLWGKGTGKFRTTGSYSAATIRGTEWLVQDTCTTTLTRVKTGVVSVRDKIKKRTIVLRKGKRYVARPRR